MIEKRQLNKIKTKKNNFIDSSMRKKEERKEKERQEGRKGRKKKQFKNFFKRLPHCV